MRDESRQMDLMEALAEPMPPHNSTETSREAARSIRSRASALKELVFNWIARQPLGATCDEAEEALGLKHQTCSARFNDLMTTGRIISAGKRPTRSGCNAMVWKVAP